MPALPDEIAEQLDYQVQNDCYRVKLTGYQVNGVQLEVAQSKVDFLFEVIDSQHTQYIAIINKAQDFFLSNEHLSEARIPILDKAAPATLQHVTHFQEVIISRAEAEGVGTRGRLVTKWKEYKKNMQFHKESYKAFKEHMQEGKMRTLNEMKYGNYANARPDKPLTNVQKLHRAVDKITMNSGL